MLVVSPAALLPASRASSTGLTAQATLALERPAMALALARAGLRDWLTRRVGQARQ